MIYVMSDLHGCYDKFEAMLNKINLTEKDCLYILGDIVDRGPSGLKIALYISAKNNIFLIRGNHDQQAAILLENIYLLQDEKMSDKYGPIFSEWLSDGGDTTIKEYIELDEMDREKVLKVFKNSFVSKEIEVNGKTYLLAHTVPEIDEIHRYEEWTIDDFIMGEPDYDEIYFTDKIIITGHTPTLLIDIKSKGKIWRKNNHIAIDCGAVYGNSLGCLRLDDMKEFYV